MRKRETNNGITVKAYSGTTGILLAFDIDENLRHDFLGFAIRREGNNKIAWLQGILTFPNESITDYKPIDSNLAPFQKFRWSDYTVYPDQDYTYEIFGMYGSPDNMKTHVGPKVTIKTESLDNSDHQIIFNRAAAASQAFSRKFPNVYPSDNPSIQSPEQSQQILEARKWLSRGLKEKIESYFKSALDNTYRLEVAIYEFELHEFADLLQEAVDRGVAVKIIYHAKSNDDQTEANRTYLRSLPKAIKVERVTSRIFHHKFAIISRKENGVWSPKQVLTGSTNWTFNGVYQQANVVHVIREKEVAEVYHRLFVFLLSNPDESITRINETKKFNSAQPVDVNQSTRVFFSPRSGFDDLKAIVAEIKNADSSLLLCSAFDIHDTIIEAIKNPTKPGFVQYGLQNKSSEITGFHREFNASFVTPAYLKEGIEKRFRKENFARRQGEGSIYIHLKTIILDFTTSNPTVITGSHNFSKPASDGNDENLIIIKGNTQVADIYTLEMFRFYDHYRFRFNQKQAEDTTTQKVKTLDVSGAWTGPYFTVGEPERKERELFSRKDE